MKVIFLYLFFLTCGFAQERRLPDSADNILLDVKKLPSAEENPAPNPEDGDISDNVEDLQRELMEEQIKVRDLNQTISDILERMADMEKNIISNEGTISENQRKIDMVNVYVATLSEDVDNNKEDIEVNQLKMELLSRDVEDITDDVATVQRDVVSVTADVEKNSANITKVFEDVAAVQEDVVVVAAEVEKNSADITTLATMGHWCGEQYVWKTVGTITYDSLTFSASNNMNYAATPLDINTGINSHKCFYYLDTNMIYLVIYVCVSYFRDLHSAHVWRMEDQLQSAVPGVQRGL